MSVTSKLVDYERSRSFIHFGLIHSLKYLHLINYIGNQVLATKHTASGAQQLSSYSNNDPWLTLTYCLARSDLVIYTVYMGKKVKQWIFHKLSMFVK